MTVGSLLLSDLMKSSLTYSIQWNLNQEGHSFSEKVGGYALRLYHRSA